MNKKNRIRERMQRTAMTFDPAQADKLLNIVATIAHETEDLSAKWDDSFLNIGYPFFESFNELAYKFNLWYESLEMALGHVQGTNKEEEHTNENPGPGPHQNPGQGGNPNGQNGQNQ